MSKLAVHGGSRAFPGPSPAWPVVEAAEKRAVLEVLESGKWWMGERVATFERRFAEFQSAAFGVACANGTVALEMALVAGGIGAGKAGCPFTCPYRRAEPPAYDRLHLPHAERACRTVIWLPHPLLLASEDHLRHIAEAFAKLWEQRAELHSVKV